MILRHASPMRRWMGFIGMTLLLLLTVLSGPVAFLSSKAGKQDTAGIYLILTPPFAQSEVAEKIQQAGARDIGVLRSPLSRMIKADATAHASLVASGAWVLSASDLAEICGVQAEIL